MMNKSKGIGKLNKLSCILISVMLILSFAQVVFALEAEDVYEENLDYMMKLIEKYYYEDVEQEDMVDGMYGGIFESLDPHSKYFEPVETEEFQEDIEGKFEGIGVYIVNNEEENYVEIVTPIKGSPAYKAGIEAGDYIGEVNGESAYGWTTEMVQDSVKGEKGTSVNIGIIREGEDQLLYFDIVRDEVTVWTVDYEILEDTENEEIGYISISQFGATTNDEFDDAMAFMVNSDVDGIIVDVRNNPGGYLDSAIHLSEYFVSSGKTIVKIDYKSSLDKTYRSEEERVPMDVVVLINEGSASASEIFAGSIKENGEGTIIGTTSYGKGTVQSIFPLEDGASMKLTIAEYILTNDYHVDGNGIVPDIEVDLPTIMEYQEYKEFAPMNETVVNYQGDTGLNIYGAQQRLNLLGAELDEDGIMGPATVVAVKEFQISEGIDPSGNLDSETVIVLNREIDHMFNQEGDLGLEMAIDVLLQ